MMKVLKKKRKGGFTLIELIVVIAILGILAAIMIPRFTNFQERAHKTQVVTDSKQIATAIEALLTEGTLAALATTTDAATIAANPVVVLSGVTATRIESLTIEADGGFTIKSTPGDVEYTATRADSDTAVTITP
ncbi:MAG TPA: ABC transporter ATP-binding protein [Clostridiales bacterium UBA8960]|nr:ABC transporter ATP-binding protein [Clostridiales bacterium UBA8960]